MFWALWVDDEHRAAKLHLKFNVLTQSPCEALVTAGNCCERKTLRKMLRKGEIVVGDRYYGLEYELLQRAARRRGQCGFPRAQRTCDPRGRAHGTDRSRPPSRSGLAGHGHFRHLLAESPRGVAIQVYCALIAALLLQSLTGKRPNKRAMEAFMLYQMGMVSEEELIASLGIEKTLN
jgi:hypothetical protein